MRRIRWQYHCRKGGPGRSFSTAEMWTTLLTCSFIRGCWTLRRTGDIWCCLTGRQLLRTSEIRWWTGIIMQDQGLAAYYLRNYGRNYFLPVVSAAYGEVHGEEKDSERFCGKPDILQDHAVRKGTVFRSWRWIPYRVMETALDYLEHCGHKKDRVRYALPGGERECSNCRLSFPDA